MRRTTEWGRVTAYWIRGGASKWPLLVRADYYFCSCVLNNTATTTITKKDVNERPMN